MTELDIRSRPLEAAWSVPARFAGRPPERQSAEVPIELLGPELAELTRGELALLAPSPRGLFGAVWPDVLAGLERRRVAVRVLYAPTGPPQSAGLANLVRTGAALPAAQDLPHFLAVRDRSVVYLPYQGSRQPAEAWAVRLRNTVVAASLASAFDAMWLLATRHAAEALGDEHDEVIRALSDGLTDDRAAARLHMSKRTFARRVATLMTDLEASSRFQAGVRAARRGWV